MTPAKDTKGTKGTMVRLTGKARQQHEKGAQSRSGKHAGQTMQVKAMLKRMHL